MSWLAQPFFQAFPAGTQLCLIDSHKVQQLIKSLSRAYSQLLLYARNLPLKVAHTPGFDLLIPRRLQAEEVGVLAVHLE